ncbi:MAG TPA: LamG-like jellyroll fold domain-containing protein [Candidatus Humimicrobiaceae bacterium]|nr:LamG-like jellyroll fold domain-containing protein [Candidatus Humimicrobiaceae bacterium]
MKKTENKKRESGLILIELLMAMAIFAISVITIFSLFISATQGVIIGLEKTRGSFLSTEALEAAFSISKNDQDYLTPGKYEVGVNRNDQNDQWVLIPKNGLMGHFLLSNNAQDSSIYKNHGIIQQVNFFEDRKGQPLAAAMFKGIKGINGSYIKTKYAFSLQIEGPLTLAAWVLDTGAGGETRTIAGKYNISTEKGGYTLYKQGNSYYFKISGPGGTASVSAPSGGSWEHVVGVYDSGDQTIRLYVNGQATGPTMTSISSINKVPETEFFIGNDASGLNPWYGRISDVRVYKRSLTANEIDGLYDSYSAPYEKSLVVSDVKTESLAGIWSFNEGEGCVIHDNSSNNNHGLIEHCSPEQQWVENRHQNEGRAVNFESENYNYIEIADSSTLQIKEKISVSLWLKTPEEFPEENRTILRKRAANAEDFSFALSYLGAEKGYGWAVSKGPVEQLNKAISTGAAIPKRWQHIVVTFDGTNKKMYINNREIYLEEGDLKFDNVGTNSNLFIGQNAAYQENLIDFAIDDLRIYNKVLDSSEIQTIFLGKTNYYLE